MKLSLTPYILIFSVVLSSCKDPQPKQDNKAQDAQEVLNSAEDALDMIEAEQEKELANAFFYVMAPSGLSLRKFNTPNSEKITTIPFGRKVKQISPVFTIDHTVENIAGSMMEVDYDGTIGYAFSGFLTPYPMPEKGEETEKYVERLQKLHPEVTFGEKETEPDFHQGIVQTLVLPSARWHEAFYLAKASYNIPNSLNFPGHEGEDKEVISQKDKEEYVWSSELVAIRSSGRLDTLQYNWRAEGGGYWITITQSKREVLVIEYTAFAD